MHLDFDFWRGGGGGGGCTDETGRLFHFQIENRRQARGDLYFTVFIRERCVCVCETRCQSHCRSRRRSYTTTTAFADFSDMAGERARMCLCVSVCVCVCARVVFCGGRARAAANYDVHVAPTVGGLAAGRDVVDGRRLCALTVSSSSSGGGSLRVALRA